VYRTPFIHIDVVIFKDNFGFYRIQAGAAYRAGGVVEFIRTVFMGHLFINFKIADGIEYIIDNLEYLSLY